MTAHTTGLHLQQSREDVERLTAHKHSSGGFHFNEHVFYTKGLEAGTPYMGDLLHSLVSRSLAVHEYSTEVAETQE